MIAQVWHSSYTVSTIPPSSEKRSLGVVTEQDHTPSESESLPSLGRNSSIFAADPASYRTFSYGTVTLLFQDMVGGLEVQDSQGQFVPAYPQESTVVVNIGDLLQRWSNDRLKSTVHRVVLPTGASEDVMTPRRNSIVRCVLSFHCD